MKNVIVDVSYLQACLPLLSLYQNLSRMCDVTNRVFSMCVVACLFVVHIYVSSEMAYPAYHHQVFHVYLADKKFSAGYFTRELSTFIWENDKKGFVKVFGLPCMKATPITSQLYGIQFRKNALDSWDSIWGKLGICPKVIV